jgi:hypothetical protein
VRQRREEKGNEKRKGAQAGTVRGGSNRGKEDRKKERERHIETERERGLSFGYISALCLLCANGLCGHPAVHHGHATV